LVATTATLAAASASGLAVAHALKPSIRLASDAAVIVTHTFLFTSSSPIHFFFSLAWILVGFSLYLICQIEEGRGSFRERMF
jgi:hypothetical protein